MGDCIGCPAPIPSLSTPQDAEILLGETANYGFMFSNTSGADTGYAPYLEVAVDTSGRDGDGLDGVTNQPGQINDGYVGAPTVVAGVCN